MLGRRCDEAANVLRPEDLHLDAVRRLAGRVRRVLVVVGRDHEQPAGAQDPGRLGEEGVERHPVLDHAHAGDRVEPPVAVLGAGDVTGLEPDAAVIRRPGELQVVADEVAHSEHPQPRQHRGVAGRARRRAPGCRCRGRSGSSRPRPARPSSSDGRGGEGASVACSRRPTARTRQSCRARRSAPAPAATAYWRCPRCAAAWLRRATTGPARRPAWRDEGPSLRAVLLLARVVLQVRHLRAGRAARRGTPPSRGQGQRVSRPPACARAPRAGRTR